MPVTRNFKQAFSGGEISPEMFGRIADNKFQQGAAEAKRCTQMMTNYLTSAKQSDNLHRDITVEHIVPWTSGR